MCGKMISWELSDRMAAEKRRFLKVILGLLPPISGTIRFYDENVEVPSLKIGYLPQMSQIDKKFPISVREVISSGLSAEKPLFRPFNRSQRERVDEVIVQMGLEELAGRAIGELSGGQLQRVLLGAFYCLPSAGIDLG